MTLIETANVVGKAIVARAGTNVCEVGLKGSYGCPRKESYIHSMISVIIMMGKKLEQLPRIATPVVSPYM